MSITILETLLNAEYNLKNNYAPFTKEIGMEQLHNAIVLFEKDYSLYDDVEPLIEKYGTAEKVPLNREEPK